MADVTRAQERLQAAMEEVVAELRGEDTGVLVDWVAVAQTTGWDGNDQQSTYYAIFAGGQMPEHRAIGLMEYGAHLVRSGQRVEE